MRSGSTERSRSEGANTIMNKPLMIIIFVCVVSGAGCITINRDNEVRITERPHRIEESAYPKLRGDFGLVEIKRVSDAAGALTPSLPMATGVMLRPGKNCLYLLGCSGFSGHVLLVKDDAGFRMARNQEDLKRMFAPIENEKEALSYAAVSTGLAPRYEFKIEKKFRTFVWKIRTTSSIRKGDGFEVNLFDYKGCGCGPHPYTMVVLHVGRDGSIRNEETVKLYEDPDQDSLCVD